jgi:hypothetical protein
MATAAILNCFNPLKVATHYGEAKKIGISWTNFAAVAMETKKGGFKKKIGFLSSNFMKLCRNIHRSVWQLLEVEKFQNGGCNKPRCKKC